MFARATSGDKKNNNKFSPCSLKSINPVLNYKARSAKGCFTGRTESEKKDYGFETNDLSSQVVEVVFMGVVSKY